MALIIGWMPAWNFSFVLKLTCWKAQNASHRITCSQLSWSVLVRFFTRKLFSAFFVPILLYSSLYKKMNLLWETVCERGVVFLPVSDTQPFCTHLLTDLQANSSNPVRNLYSAYWIGETWVVKESQPAWDRARYLRVELQLLTSAHFLPVTNHILAAFSTWTSFKNTKINRQN